jgi:hypothetical protein
MLPDTFNDDNNVAALFNVVVPDTFKTPSIEVELHNTFIAIIKIPYLLNPDSNIKFVFAIVLNTVSPVDADDEKKAALGSDTPKLYH